MAQSSGQEVTIGTAKIIAGTGTPVGTAATKGTLFIRTDGSTTSSRLYVNSTGLTAWVSVTTSA